MIFFKLFLTFFRIGLFTIGGGLATLPYLQELATKYGWITSEELINMIAISESTPGPIGINVATFVGNDIAGLSGGIVATLGLITPSIIIIIIIAHYFAQFSETHIVRSAFYGIRPAVAGLIGAAGFQIAKISLFNIDKYYDTSKILDFFDLKSLVLFAIILFLVNKYKKHPIVYIVGAAVVGIIFNF